MLITKKAIGAAILGAVLFSGCVGPNDFVYEGENYGSKRTDSYKDGVIAGCKTAKGSYRKNHEKFNTIADYQEGWFAGRRRCQGPIW